MLAAWETIRKFVLEKGRDFRQRRRRVVEEDIFDQLPSKSDVPLRLAEPQFEEPSGLAVQGRVKWFNPSKGYGFVELLHGSGDAFLHATVLGRIGISAVQPGETLELRVAPGQRGPQVTEVISVDSSTAAPSRPPRASFRSPSDRPASEVSVQETGTVKWYNATMGFGFIARDSGGKDVFVRTSALQRAGIPGLNEGQRVIVDVAEGRKGPEAASIQLA
jgi:CspA family cold shock protein